MTKIKICGLFRPEDIGYVNEAGPDWCGFIIHYPKSHRNVEPDTVRRLRAGLRGDIMPVGVFVDRPPEEVADLLRDGTIMAAQLHGHEDEKYIASLREMVPGCTLWKAFTVRSRADIEAANASGADLVLLDCGRGAGEVFDWPVADGMTRPYILAGGLTPANIPAAIRRLHPFGLDISSGVETEKKKDRWKIIAAVTAARKE